MRALLRARREDRSLRHRVAVLFAGLTVAVVVMLTLIALALAGSVSRGNDVVYRWQPAVARSQTLLSDLLDEETAVRGYAATGRPDLRASYDGDRIEEDTDSARMRNLLRGRPGLIARLDAFDTAVESWHRQTAEPLLSAAATTGTAAYSDADRARFDSVRSAAQQLTSAVERAAQNARAARVDAIVFLIVAIAVSFAGVLVAGFGVWRGLHRWVLAPVDTLAEQTQLVAAGDVNRVIRPAGPSEFADLATDVERMRRRIADELDHAQRTQEDLRRSNADLEQFAYVASHDLSEPLRKVANFCQLLERQYGPDLDDRARQYIAYAVDGAKRMQALIADLLALSRVGRTTDSFVDVDTAEVLDQALATLADRVDATGAGIGHSDLPTVPGDRALLTALFENLVGNAIKYRGAEPPLVVVTAVRQPAQREWLFTVSDNGIGIDPQFAERIFAIFQRLHLRDEYDGTGIGLALCRKIVDFHGGRIWLDTEADGPGATFRFTLPERPTRAS